ncbi:MAG: patatin-like phospholipase family protein [Ardenticatenia bacterium]|nr:patatin-like phospholipase family protein [Ardenticatenia bacterium]
MRKEDVYPGTHLTALWNLVRRRESLFSNANWYRFVHRHMPVRRFGELQIPAYAVATDLETGRVHVFGDTPEDYIIDGIMASTALPPLHPPWHVAGRRYIDGGAVADLPVRVAMDRGAQEIIALNLANTQTPGEQLRTLAGIVHQAIGALIVRHVTADLEYAQLQNVNVRTIQLRHQLSLPPWDFSHSAELIALGREITQAALQAEPFTVPSWKDRLTEHVVQASAPLLAAVQHMIGRRLVARQGGE